MSFEPEKVGTWKLLDAKLDFAGTHAALLRDGRVLYWSYNPQAENDVHQMHWQLFDPAKGEVTPTRRYGHNLFCAGHCFLPDGRLFVAGGQSFNTPPVGIWGADHGTHLFDPATSAWTTWETLSGGRYYPTVAPLPDGSAFVLSGANGRITEVVKHYLINRTAEVYRAADGRLEPELPMGGLIQTMYPFVFALPRGEENTALFVLSGAESELYYLEPGPRTSRGAWAGERAYCSVNANHNYPHQGSAVVLPYGEGDGSLKVMIVGGGSPQHAGHHVVATDQPEIFEYPFHTQAPHAEAHWRKPRGGKLATGRFMGDSVLLADGTVLVANGAGEGSADHSHRPVQVPELFDPETETFRQLARQAHRRMYHSSALLLPDARVLVAGNTEHWNPDNEVEDPTLELFTPPYLYRNARPRITHAPDALALGGTFEVKVESALQVRKLHLIRMASTTHTLNTDQRCVRLAFAQKGANTLEAKVPVHPALVLPGYHMLFAVDVDGTPSVAKIVHVPAPALPELPDEEQTLELRGLDEVDTGIWLEPGDRWELRAQELTSNDVHAFSLIARLTGEDGRQFFFGAHHVRETFQDSIRRKLVLRLNNKPGPDARVFQVTVTIQRTRRA